MGYSQRVPAAERTIRLLELLASSPDGLTAGELEAALGIPRSALFALLNTLKSLDYVEQREDRGPYRPGTRMQALRQPRAAGDSAVVMAFYEEVATHPFDETVALLVLDGWQALVIAQVETDRPVRSVLPPGQRLPAPESAGGLVLLAGQAIERRLEGDPRGKAGLASGELHTTLADVRRRVIAEHRGEDVVELAVPICPNGWQPEAALLVSVPAFRCSPQKVERLLETLRETAARISHRLGAISYRPYGEIAPQRLGPTVAMTADELQTFLNKPWAARLACLRLDGTPHVVPVWYEWTGQAFLIAAWPGSHWAAFVEQRPSVALTVDEPWPPLRRVLARGDAEGVSPRSLPGGLDPLLHRLSARYLGTAGQVMGPLTGEAAEWRVFRIRPIRLSGQRERLGIGE